MMARNILFMYEASAAIPMIVAGPGVPEGKVSTTPVTLIDIAPRCWTHRARRDRETGKTARNTADPAG
jgi:hypothetical protein